MGTYKVEVIETTNIVYNVDADSIELAIEAAEYGGCEIVSCNNVDFTVESIQRVE